MSIVEIITVGREILDGRVVDTNAVEIAEALRPLGLTPRFGQRVDDQIDRVVESFKIAATRSDIILVTGGLGPTSDDLTAESFAKFIGKKLVMNQEALGQIEEMFKRIGRSMIETQKKQALLPEQCLVLPNAEGTAPGFAYRHEKAWWYFMPGVPREMRRMLKEQIAPKLPSVKAPRSVTWATQFTSEGKLQEQLAPIEKQLPSGFELTYRTRFPENHIGLHASCDSPDRESAFDEACRAITETLGETVFTIAVDESLKALEEVVLDRLRGRGLMLATVESCTGGLIANRITNVPGSSAVFWGGFVTYDNTAKQGALGVAESMIAEHGAVSKEVAMALAEQGLAKMAQALNDESRDGVCIATTGIAGPGGGTAAKPVGLCYIGLAITGEPTRFEEVRGRAALSRDQYKTLFAQKALELVRQAL